MLSMLILLAALSLFLTVYGLCVKSWWMCAAGLMLLAVAALLLYAVGNAPIVGFAV